MRRRRFCETHLRHLAEFKSGGQRSIFTESRRDVPSYLRHLETRLVYCDPDCYGSVCLDYQAIGPFNQHEAGAILKSVLEPFQEVRDKVVDLF